MAAGSKYYDIVLYSKTGLGRTTLAGKLLDLENTDDSKIHQFGFQLSKPYSGEPIAGKCELISNEETKVRVLDVPGLSGIVTGQQTTEQKNEEIVRWIGSVQSEFQLRIKRIVYFLPGRGPLSKADGSMQEELKLLHHYFGRQAFDCMVVAATNPRKFQHEFDNSELEETKMVFHTALKMASTEDTDCPPLVYIGFNDTPKEALRKIRGVTVLREGILPSIKEDIGPLYPTQRIRNINYNKDTQPKPYHPTFVPKYALWQKILGGLAYLLLLGIPLLIFYCTSCECKACCESWPGFTNSEKVCSKCGKTSEENGCTTMKK